MVNANIIISVSAVAIATLVSIVVWMHMKGKTTADMTLLEACHGYFGEQGIAGAEPPSTETALNSCDTIQANNWDWDTAIPCAPESDSFYTMRGVFDATDRDMAAIKSKAAVEGEGGEANEVINYISAQCHGEGRKLISELGAERELGFYNDINYNSCSVNLALSFLGSNWANDNAECSGNPLTKGNCWGARGMGVLNKWPRSGSNWLTQGCYNHDVCLQKGGNGNSASPFGSGNCGDNTVYGAGYAGSSYGGGHGRDCDFYLGDAAKHCASDWRWVWVSSGSWWRPGWPEIRWDCSDSTVYSVAVWAAIGGVRPNAGFCGI